MTDPRRLRRRFLDLAELREGSLIAELMQAREDVAEPDDRELAVARVLTHWSVAPGPLLFGIDEWGEVRAVAVIALASDLTWAMTERGTVRLRVQSKLPLVMENRP